MEVFLKRAERSFKEKLGEDKTNSILNNIKKTTNEIPANSEELLAQKYRNSYLITHKRSKTFLLLLLRLF